MSRKPLLLGAGVFLLREVAVVGMNICREEVVGMSIYKAEVAGMIGGGLNDLYLISSFISRREAFS